MTRLDELNDELEKVMNMTETEAMREYNCDSKSSIIQLIKKDIIIEESAELNNDNGMDYDALCHVQGLSRYC